MINIELDPHGKSLTDTTVELGNTLAELENTFEKLGMYVCNNLCIHQQRILEKEKDIDEELEKLDRERCMNCPIQLLY